MTVPRDDNAGGSDAPAAPLASAGRPLRVLVVDDHLLARCSIRRQLLELPDLQVVGEATDGFEAVALAKTLSPDLVFMDISMPGLNGIEATRRVTLVSPRVRVIILSSHDGLRDTALAAGAAGYLLKGQTIQNLAAAIQQVFENS